jgi:hypothetical protein
MERSLLMTGIDGPGIQPAGRVAARAAILDGRDAGIDAPPSPGQAPSYREQHVAPNVGALAAPCGGHRSGARQAGKGRDLWIDAWPPRVLVMAEHEVSSRSKVTATWSTKAYRKDVPV